MIISVDNTKDTWIRAAAHYGERTKKIRIIYPVLFIWNKELGAETKIYDINI